jgi:hypothetical protein
MLAQLVRPVKHGIIASTAMKTRRVARILLVLGLVGAATASAFQGFRGEPYPTDAAYDGRFTFLRLRWKIGSLRSGGMGSAWNHDYPRAEQHLAQILKEVTMVDVRTDGARVLHLDDPELFKYPIAYMWEPGFWTMTDVEAARFREYLQKGGFAIFDDFDTVHWNNFEAQMRRVLPDGRWVELDESNAIFDSFFRMNTIYFPSPGMRIKPTYFGIHEDNDPTRRLMAIANYNADVAEYWEWSAEGLLPFDTSNEAYKLGVNYMIYGMTH